jgi:DNA-binding CsgD family transcriptional regulator
MDIRVAVRQRAACKGRVNLAGPDVPKRALFGPFSYVESLSAGRSQLVRHRPRSRFGAERVTGCGSDRTRTHAGQLHRHSPDLSCHVADRDAQAHRALPLPLSHRGSRVAPVRGACGVAFVTTRPQPAAFVRVVTKHGSEAHKTERERVRTVSRPQLSQEEVQQLTRATFSREERSGPRRRRDRGTFRVSERDVEVLGLIAEQYAVTLDQLARLIGRSYRTARGLRDRWCSAGWTHSAKLTVNLPPFVWLTRQGSRLVDSPYRTWDANLGLATHIGAVTDLRLLLERELRLGQWECERSLAQSCPSHSASRPHLPDAVLICDQRIAIEVELTRKSRVRLAPIVEQLSWDYDSVWYFAPERLRPALFEFATAAPYDNVTIHCYPPDRADWQVRADLDRTWA